MNCKYCQKEGKRINAENDNPIYLCDLHQRILSSAKTAIPFYRGYLAKELRGRMGQAELSQRIESFINTITKFKPTLH